jgi:hypothetical protein
VRRVLFAKFFSAFVGGIRDGHDFDFRMLLQPRQVPVPHDGACADDSDPQLVIVRPAHKSGVNLSLTLARDARSRFA